MPIIVTKDELGPVVRRIVGAPATIETWVVDMLPWSNIMSGRLARAGGIATVQARTPAAPWAAILKAFPRPPLNATASDPRAWDYWRREVDAYGGQALRRLPGGITVPETYGIIERSDGTVVLAMEEITDTADARWALPDFERHARTMGRFGGAYLVGHVMPAEASLQSGPLRSWVEELRTAVLNEPRQTWSTPLAAAVLGDEDLEPLIASAPALLDALELLPHTFTHRDVNPGNLLVRHAAAPVLIDWALAGAGPVGEETACMVGSAVFGLPGEPGAPESIEAAVVAGYELGLRDAGWDGPARLVSFGHAASMALRFALLVAYWGARLAMTHDPAWFERRFGRPLPAIAEGWHHLLELALRRWRDAVAYIS